MMSLRANLLSRFAAIAVLGLAQLVMGSAQVWHHHDHDHDPSERVPGQCDVCLVIAQPTIADPGPTIPIAAPAVFGEVRLEVQAAPGKVAAPAAVARGPPAA